MLSWLRSCCIAALLLAVAGCAALAPPPLPVHRAPEAVAPKPFESGRAPVALVLSGGALRGYAHVGVIKVLEEEGIRPDLIVGTSAGSIVGALYASGLPATEVEEALKELDWRTFSDVVLPGLGLIRGELGFVRGEYLHRFIDRHARQRHIEDFPIRFAAVATDLKTGAPVAFNKGDAGVAIRASSAVPGIVSPVHIDAARYGDGQMSSPLPTAAARALGAKIVIAVDVGYPPEHSELFNAFSVMFQAFIIAARRLSMYELAEADVIIAPQFPRTGQFSLADRPMLVALGAHAAREALPRIRARLSAPPDAQRGAAR